MRTLFSIFLFGLIQILTVSAHTKTNPDNRFTIPLNLHQTSIERDKSSFLIRTSEGWTIKISFLTSTILRIQMAPSTGFEPSLNFP